MDSRRLSPSPELRASHRRGSNQQITVAGYGFKARAVQRPAGVRNGVPKQTFGDAFARWLWTVSGLMQRQDSERLRGAFNPHVDVVTEHYKVDQIGQKHQINAAPNMRTLVE
jgi:hypothetical protein